MSCEEHVTDSENEDAFKQLRTRDLQGKKDVSTGPNQLKEWFVLRAWSITILRRSELLPPNFEPSATPGVSWTDKHSALLRHFSLHLCIHISVFSSFWAISTKENTESSQEIDDHCSWL